MNIFLTKQYFPFLQILLLCVFFSSAIEEQEEDEENEDENEDEEEDDELEDDEEVVWSYEDSDQCPLRGFLADILGYQWAGQQLEFNIF